MRERKEGDKQIRSTDLYGTSPLFSLSLTSVASSSDAPHELAAGDLRMGPMTSTAGFLLFLQHLPFFGIGGSSLSSRSLTVTPVLPHHSSMAAAPSSSSASKGEKEKNWTIQQQQQQIFPPPNSQTLHQPSLLLFHSQSQY